MRPRRRGVLPLTPNAVAPEYRGKGMKCRNYVSELAVSRKAVSLVWETARVVALSVLFMMRDGRELLRAIRQGLNPRHQAYSALLLLAR